MYFLLFFVAIGFERSSQLFDFLSQPVSATSLRKSDFGLVAGSLESDGETRIVLEGSRSDVDFDEVEMLFKLFSYTNLKYLDRRGDVCVTGMIPFSSSGLVISSETGGSGNFADSEFFSFLLDCCG